MTQYSEYDQHQCYITWYRIVHDKNSIKKNKGSELQNSPTCLVF